MFFLDFCPSPHSFSYMCEHRETWSACKESVTFRKTSSTVQSVMSGLVQADCLGIRWCYHSNAYPCSLHASESLTFHLHVTRSRMLHNSSSTVRMLKEKRSWHKGINVAG